MPFTTPVLLNTVALSDPDPPLDDSVAVPIDPLVASSFSCTVKSVPLPAMLDWVAAHHEAAADECDDAALRTYAGALAYHWRYMHMNGGRHPHTAETCALHAFLAARELADSEPARWHAAVHRADGDADGASRRLLAWLAGEVSASRAALLPRDVPGPRT